jgi:transcriptional regulator GlxA family with amidase domain
MNHSLKRRDFLKTGLAATVSAQLINAQDKSKGVENNMPKKPLEIVFYLHPGMTALDAIGAYEVLRGLPNATIRFVAKERGLVRVDSQVLSLNADFAIREIKAADILVLPGGLTTPAQMQDQELLAWVRLIHEKSKWTTSVCSGSLILGAAGLLKGLEATSHWLALDALKMFGAKPTHQRVVQQGKIITAAGVSAGIDMALKLAALESGEETAKAIQLTIEYDPQPPFNSGSVEKSSPATIEKAKAFLAESTRIAAAAK